MTKRQTIIVGCGDVGLRIAKRLSENNVLAFVSSEISCQKLAKHQVNAQAIQLDNAQVSLNLSASEIDLYYLVPPQLSGEEDQRSRVFLQALSESVVQQPTDSLRIVLISTTGVYGDHDGEWVTEATPTEPQTDRAKRRLSLEQQWQDFVLNAALTNNAKTVMSILRVPGIYSHSRLPRERLEKQTPLVNPDECGYTNRIHADDLAMICTEVMQQQQQTDVYNVSDGTPGKISEYLLEAAKVLGIQSPPLISMDEADKAVSAGMLSYLRESRKISHHKLMESFDLELQYPDFKQGILR